MDERLIADLKGFFEHQEAVEAAAIFGAFAKSDKQPDNVMEIMVIGDLSGLKLNAQLRQLAREAGREMWATVFEHQQFIELMNSNSIIQEAMNSPLVPLKGILPKLPV